MFYIIGRWFLSEFTRPKPVGHGYVFSFAVGTIGEWLKLVPFLLGDEQLILKGGGGGGGFFKKKNPFFQTLLIKNFAWAPRKKK